MMNRFSLVALGAASTMFFSFAMPADAQCSSTKTTKAAATSSSDCQSTSECGQTKPMQAAFLGGKPDIVDTAVSAGKFSTLVAACKAAGLVDALKGDGPFTVFAPNDDAFAKLAKGTVASLLEPKNKGLLTAILTYHVVPGRLAARDVTRVGGAVTLNDQRLDFRAEGDKVMVDNARVLSADIECGNGIIHVIDSVVMPAGANIVETAKGAGTFETLLAAASTAGLAGALQGDGPFTVFAPTDEAFAKLPKGTVESLLKPENREKLATILKYHVIPAKVYAKAAAAAGQAKTLTGQSVMIDIQGGRLCVDGASIVATDIDASNGVIHVIDRVILPN